MKPNKLIVLIFMSGLLMASCSDYLEKTPDADVTDEDIFGTFSSFQGFIEPAYGYFMDYNEGLITAMNIGGETATTGTASSSGASNQGDYRIWMTRTNNQTLFNHENTRGIWTGSWKGIRLANLALDKLPLLVNATQEEKDLIEGQAYFFRAFFYWEIIRSFGGMPHIDRVLSPNETMDFPRLGYQATTEKIVADFDRAVELLPEDWDKTVVGSAFANANDGRATKGAALGFKAKALLFAGSPLMNHETTQTYEYNTEYMKRAAEAAWEVIKLADQGVYTLQPFTEYQKMFARSDGFNLWTTETIFEKMRSANGSTPFNLMGRIYWPARFNGNTNTECINQIYIDRFEMADGTRYKMEYDTDNARRWNDRDPRFRQNIIVDRDQWGTSPQTLLKLYIDGDGERTLLNGFRSPYLTKKYWPKGSNTYDGNMGSYRQAVPHLRLAEIYLIYAEAVNEAYGATGSVPGANFTAVQAVNVVRQRAGQPATSAAAATAAGYSSFRDLIRNERMVELCFEGHYWFDIRRWYVGHLPEYKEFWDLEFNKAWTSFTRKLVFVRVFENPKHYWMPLPTSQTQIYPGFYQNPGWQ